ncbi:MAG: hypothetical protein KDK45_15565, partial [Leptospiraceae bacterium]|nr:hypothetical protein [Leptospiraceae bacterium]
MDLFLLSYHSISVFTVFIISSIIVVYLGIKKDKILSTYWLLGVFLGYMFLYLGHFLSYSIFSPIAAYSTFFSQLSLLGVACFVAFSYHYPKNVYKQESKIAIPLSFGLAFLAISIFLFQSMTMDKMYSFSEHKYDFSAGGFSTLISLLLHLWCFIILFRKTILYSGYDGFLSKWGMHKSLRGEKEINGSEGINRSANILISLLKFFHPVGKDANSIKGFSRAMLLLTVLSFMGLLNSSGLISQEFYAYIFSAISLVLSFYIILIYLNNSSESTTLMIKLVGISLVTLLIVVGYIGQVMLRMSETDYDKLRLSEVKNSRTNILMERFKELPESIVYVLKKPNTEIAEPSTYELLFSRDSIVSLPEIVNFETRQLEGRKDVLKSKFPALSDKDLNQLAKKELASYSSLQYERLYRNAGIFYIHY